MRQQLSLAGTWQFQLDPDGTVRLDTLAPDRHIAVPLPWQAAFPELEHYDEYAWYRRSIDLTNDWINGELLLRFGAVDYWCQVYVNGQLAGEHEGGYTPFTLPIRAYVRAGHNEIAVRVYDPVQTAITIPRWPNDAKPNDSTQPPFDARDIPHGKQEWYINVGGIWQDVTLTALPKTYIDHIRVTPDIHTGRAEVTVVLAGDVPNMSSGTLKVAVDPVHAATVPLAAGQAVYTANLQIDQPQLWNLDTPQLYTVMVSLDAAGIQDSTRARFGFREISYRDGRLYLNGEPLFLLSALDQDIYPDTIYTVPSDDFLRDQFQKAKALGLNNLRCHIKPPDPRYLDIADEMGLLVWAEIPSWRTFHIKTTVNPAAVHLPNTIKARVEKTLEEMIRRDYNHPSLIIWTIVNEDWGTTLPLSDRDRAWLRGMYDRCKQLDPTRLVVDNSPCLSGWGPNVHVKSDIDDFHIYTNIPDQADTWEQIIEQFSLRPLWTYSNHGDTDRTGHEPLILSEFGNWGLPSLHALCNSQGELPAWFKLGGWWSPQDGLPGWPQGVVERFRALGLDAIWPDYEAFAAATQWHQFAALKYEIETMRRQTALAGYVITELSDIYWESNGLLDFNRQPKAFHQKLCTINTPDMIIPQLAAYVCWSDQAACIRLYGAHYSAADWSGSRVCWSAGKAHGERTIPLVERGTVQDFGTERLTFPDVIQTQVVSVQLTLENAACTELARNDVDLLVLPASARQAAYRGELAVVTRKDMRKAALAEASLAPAGADPSTVSGAAPDGPIATADAASTRAPVHYFAQFLAGLGYHAAPQMTTGAQVIVTDYPTAAHLAWVRSGGLMLLLSSGPGPFFWSQSRGGTYSGNWISNYSWLRPGVYRRLRVNNPLGLPFASIMPKGTLLGLPVEKAAIQPDFLAGQIAGWVQLPAIHTVQFRYGNGKVIMTTFTLKEALLENPDDPAAVAMFHDLIDHLTSDACQPTLTANY